ncbi:MAG TPA: PIN domain-containing protein [Thermoplasmatales archaeon]|nr:PIN domain-containing protein [Thermoplasmatales archaeon]
MSSLYFLDSNVIIDWIVISTKLEQDVDIEKGESIQARFREKSYAYTVVNLLLGEPNVDVMTCDLALAESYGGVKNEIVCEKLYRRGIPYSMWKSHEKYEKLRGDDLDLFHSTMTKYFRKLKKSVRIARDIVDDDVFPLLYHKGNVGIYDSILITTAIMNGANIFITQDTRIVKLKNKAFYKFGTEPIKPIILLKSYTK